MRPTSGNMPPYAMNALDMGKRSRGAAVGLLFYDHLITLDLEIPLIWKQNKRRPAFFLYLFVGSYNLSSHLSAEQPDHRLQNRFFALAFLIFDTIPVTKDGILSSHILRSCVIYLMCDDIVTMVTTLTVQLILQLRVYALYNRSRKILIFLLCLCAMELSIMAILVGITMGHLDHLPLSSTTTGCYYRGILGFSALFWVPGLVYEPILFLLVLYKAWPSERNGPSVPLITRIARDSLLYFVVIFAELLISTVVWARTPTYINMVMPWSAALPSILGSRLLLNMREVVMNRGNMKSYVLETFEGVETNSIPFRRWVVPEDSAENVNDDSHKAHPHL
ncbi:hypothetical protein QCA50_004225 [Cerrena zonata]|uniref:DUF6533 domain-containing protein n=1 Tax=Cerrena zonata TaxID=2478898 RepID=A0AAW0GLA9_9APHY